MVLMHEDLVPPDSLEGYSDGEVAQWKTEYDVTDTLKTMGHEVVPLGLSDEIGLLRTTIQKHEPHVAFNLLEEFHSIGSYDQYVTGFLELMRQPYTGCNPRGLFLSRDKVLSKEILTYHRIPTPRFAVFPLGKRLARHSRLRYPLFVKSATEDASLGIAQASIVRSEEELRERISFVHKQTKSDALVEEYIEGRELYVGIVGNERLQTFPVWEMSFGKMPETIARIATRKVKWDRDYQKRHGITTGVAKNLPNGMEARIVRLSKRIFRVLKLSGYARMDLRLTEEGELYVLEANANPDLTYGEDFAESAHSLGLPYDKLLQRIINLGMSYKAEWRE